MLQMSQENQPSGLRLLSFATSFDFLLASSELSRTTLSSLSWAEGVGDALCWMSVLSILPFQFSSSLSESFRKTRWSNFTAFPLRLLLLFGTWARSSQDDGLPSNLLRSRGVLVVTESLVPSCSDKVLDCKELKNCSWV